MRNEYSKDIKSKSAFVILGVVVILLLMLLLQSCGSSQSHERRENKNAEKRQEIALDAQSLSLQSSLYQDGNVLIGFVKSSDKSILKTYKKSLKKYADIVRSTDEGFIFLAEGDKNILAIYQILKKHQPSFRDVWYENW
jgi:CHASE3 domain sensor protein